MHAKRLQPGLVALIGTAAILSACGSKPNRKEASPASVTGVMVETVHLQNALDVYEAVGTVRSATSSVLGAQIPGTVREIRVKPGDRVRRGQLLALFDDRGPRAQLAAAQAGVDEARFGVAEIDQALQAATAERKLAEVTYQRYRELLARNSVTRQEFDGAETRYRSALAAEAALEAKKKGAGALGQQARSRHDSAETEYSYSRIVSPIDGVVTAKAVDAGTLVMPGTAILTVEDTAHYRLEATVPQEMLPNVHPGEAIGVWTEGGQVNGTVVEIVPAADPGSRTFLVKVALPMGCACRSGEYGKAAFPMGEKKALAVSRSALVERGELEGVYVVNPQGEAEYRLVTIGKRMGERVEILSGLSEGERVATSRLDQLSDGARVELR